MGFGRSWRQVWSPGIPAGQPTKPEFTAYLATAGTTASDTDLQDAIDAETSDQLARLRFPLRRIDPAPTDGSYPFERYYPAALREALFRRVAHNLVLRGLPLGVQASIADGAVATNFVGGLDAEVARLEKPWRKRKVG